jgi:hypothetical protein
MRANYVAGFLDSGIQPRGTPITAEPVYGNELLLNVAWIDEQGGILSASLSDSDGPGWRWYMSNGVVQDRRQGRKPAQASQEIKKKVPYYVNSDSQILITT